MATPRPACVSAEHDLHQVRGIILGALRGHRARVWLFGSHAWGTPHEDSDVDLMVIVSQSDERAIQRMQRAHVCLKGIGFPKDVLVPTRAEVDRYKHLRASLFHQVLAKGRKLYG